MNTPNPKPENAGPEQAQSRKAESDPVLDDIDEEELADQKERDRQQGEVAINLTRWFMVILSMPFLWFGVYQWEKNRHEQVISSKPIGELLDLQPVTNARGLRPAILLLKTSTGFVSLRDPLNLASGVALVREERKSGRSYVCDVPRTQCAWIAERR